MAEYNLDEIKYKMRKRFFFRFLKENNLYALYWKYSHDKKTQNHYQREHLGNWTWDGCAKYYGIQSMMSMLIIWDKTKEGHAFWYGMHNKFLKEFNEWNEQTKYEYSLDS